MKELSLEEVARHVSARIVGDGSACVSSVVGMEEAGPGQITFLANRRYAKLLASTKATAVIVGEAVDCPVTQLVVENPYYAFMQVVELLHGHRRHKETGISPLASVDPSAQIGPGTHIHEFATIRENVRIGSRCFIYPGAYVGAGSQIGDDCILHPNVAVYDEVVIGQRVVIESNASIGQDGFGFATHRGVHHKIPHLGRVVVEDDVAIGSSCCVQRGALQDTVVGRGTRMGDGAILGHGVRVGEGCVIVSQVGIAGSTTVGKHCVFAGQVGVAGHLKIGDRVTVGACSGVMNDLETGAKVFGAPAFELRRSLEAQAALRALPELRKTVRMLEKKVAQLERGQGSGGKE